MRNVVIAYCKDMVLKQGNILNDWNNKLWFIFLLCQQSQIFFFVTLPVLIPQGLLVLFQVSSIETIIYNTTPIQSSENPVIESLCFTGYIRKWEFVSHKCKNYIIFVWFWFLIQYARKDLIKNIPSKDIQHFHFTKSY